MDPARDRVGLVVIPETGAAAHRIASPLADLRSLGGSTFFHVALLTLASLLVFSVTYPPERIEPRTLNTEVGPVDNRVHTDDGGGAPGESGGQGRIAASELRRMLDEVLSPQASADLPRWLRPRGERGQGAKAGPGSGGGGGSGGGSGGGQGGDVGRGTEFFGTKETGQSFVYVIDRSGSMANRDSLGVAKRELTNSLDELGDDRLFAVVFYDTRAEWADGNALKPATTENKARLITRLERIEPDGGTDHEIALYPALALRPEVIFFLTDADRMTDGEADDILKAAGRTRIHTVQFGAGSSILSSDPMRRLAATTGGTYRYIDVTTFR